mmetsp:Transcript_16094/g.41421  ORF Transcript_16094/g.41421 Transcript_16094/m.41421 type:complete len:207 (-) Transcript_16094:355-975(-)
MSSAVPSAHLACPSATAPSSRWTRRCSTRSTRTRTASATSLSSRQVSSPRRVRRSRRSLTLAGRLTRRRGRSLANAMRDGTCLRSSPSLISTATVSCRCRNSCVPSARSVCPSATARNSRSTRRCSSRLTPTVTATSHSPSSRRIFTRRRARRSRRCSTLAGSSTRRSGRPRPPRRLAMRERALIQPPIGRRLQNGECFHARWSVT